MNIYHSKCCDAPVTHHKATLKTERHLDPSKEQPKEVIGFGLGTWHCRECGKPCKVSCTHRRVHSVDVGKIESTLIGKSGLDSLAPHDSTR